MNCVAWIWGGNMVTPLELTDFIILDTEGNL